MSTAAPSLLCRWLHEVATWSPAPDFAGSPAHLILPLRTHPLLRARCFARQPWLRDLGSVRDYNSDSRSALTMPTLRVRNTLRSTMRGGGCWVHLVRALQMPAPDNTCDAGTAACPAWPHCPNWVCLCSKHRRSRRWTVAVRPAQIGAVHLCGQAWHASFL